MSEEELKSWFLDKFNSCYKVKHHDYPNSIFWYYSKSYIRKMKLFNINQEIILLPDKIKGICLFEQELKYNYLYCDIDTIWTFFYNFKLHQSYSNIQLKITNIIKDTNMLNDDIIISTNRLPTYPILEDINKLTIL